MTHEPNDDAELALKIAQNHFQTTKECPWESIDPTIQTVIALAAYAWLRDAKPVLLEAGWTPPQGTHTP